MKLVKNQIDAKTGIGPVTLIATEPEDMWHLYNIVLPGDIVRASAVRKVKMEGGGADITKRVHTTFTIVANKIEFDPADSQLRVSGQVCEQNEYAEMGSHHTLDLELHRQFTLTKGVEAMIGRRRNNRDDGKDGDAAAAEGQPWDSITLDVLRQACDVRRSADVWAVVMQEGLANICVITEYQTHVRQRIEVSIPRKRIGHGADAHDKAIDKFLETILQALLRNIDFAEMQSAATKEGRSLPPLLLASPGFTAQAFQKHFIDYAVRTGDKNLVAYAKQNALVAHSSNGYVHALNEVLKQPAVLARLSDTKYARESQVMEKFFELLRLDDGRAWYGPKEVEKAVDKGGVGRGGGILLMSNSLFRSSDPIERKKWVALVDRVGKVEGGEVRILSSAHESGKRLEGLGNIAAILTFPMPDLDEEEEGEQVPEPVRGQDHDRNDAELINL